MTLKHLPETPGVYLMKEADGRVIYVGKAKNLKKRVSSYFAEKREMFWKTSRLVSRVKDIDFIVTDNEVEAILLESNLIKRFRPLFNIELKDQQRYAYLKITDEKFPRLLVARRNRNGDFYGTRSEIYGPLVHGGSKFLSVGLLRKLFKIRICNKMPRHPCLEYFIKNCDAPCVNNISSLNYAKNVRSLRNILSGKEGIKDFMNDMKSQMKIASDQEHYEKAREIRDMLHKLENLQIEQKMEAVQYTNREEEYIGIKEELEDGIAHVLMFRRSRGVICDKKWFQFELIGDNSLESFLFQYYSTAKLVPAYIYVNQKVESKSVLETSLKTMAGHKVMVIKISSKSNSEKKQLMDLILKNIDLRIQGKFDLGICELKTVLNLADIPIIVDCFDISNLGTSYAVGACTRVVNGRPYKAGYRRFKIKLTGAQNDVAMINEIVTRRYSSTLDLNDGQDQLPNLIVIDGGKGQLNSAANALGRLGLEIPCISIAKAEEIIYSYGSDKEIILPKSSAALKIVQLARDEAHRFGLAYNMKLRKINRSVHQKEMTV
ncbi:MAG: excinuclease ABC subunit UvrC [Nitrososphaeraceae archaeon]